MLRPPLIILPHSAVGGCAPRFRKLSPASSIIIVPMSSMAVTRIGPRIFGRICRRIICMELSPESRAAATKPLLLSASV